MLAQAIVVAFALIVLPLTRFASCGTQVPRPWAFVTYFASLGLGFIMIEIVLIQRFLLFLGQPTYTFGVVLAGLFVFTGIGSSVVGPLRRRLSARSYLHRSVDSIGSLLSGGRVALAPCCGHRNAPGVAYCDCSWQCWRRWNFSRHALPDRFAGRRGNCADFCSVGMGHQRLLYRYRLNCGINLGNGNRVYRRRDHQRRMLFGSSPVNDDVKPSCSLQTIRTEFSGTLK